MRHDADTGLPETDRSSLRLLERLRGDAPGDPGGMRARLGARAWKHRWFLGVAVVPILLAGIYYGLIASDQYVSEARFIVRKANGEQTLPLGGFLQTAGLAPAQDDSLAIQDFIMSRDAVRDLEKDIALRAILSRPEGDFINRFPGPFDGKTFEELHQRYEDFVEVTLDSSSGITTLKAYAFRADDARTLAAALLEESENLINRLNDRAQQDTLDLARAEVRRAEQEVIASQARITEYRLRNKMIDPETGSMPLLELIGKLSAELAATQAQLGEIQSASPRSPQIKPLRDRAAALQSQIAQERGKVVGQNSSMVTKISEYERLFLQRQFADKALASATLSLETARLKAQREHIYLERIVEPNLADYPLYPRRFYSFLIAAISVLMIYGIGRLVTSSVKEHVGR
ncbi:capsule biosynthesis protein [Iodidimonas sp. SYSU 1G8]|uniref:capsule biosynthesis protein n=1 Tax=Iodidimonas sp. SYSU 1G8 TaxID=3133967 RepID=UPI0031FE9C79